MSKVLFDNTKYYQVEQLEEPTKVENNGVTLYLSYSVVNILTGVTEGYAQFLPSAIEQATNASATLEKYLDGPEEVDPDAVIKGDGTVVSLKA